MANYELQYCGPDDGTGGISFICGFDYGTGATHEVLSLWGFNNIGKTSVNVPDTAVSRVYFGGGFTDYNTVSLNITVVSKSGTTSKQSINCGSPAIDQNLVTLGPGGNVDVSNAQTVLVVLYTDEDPDPGVVPGAGSGGGGGNTGGEGGGNGDDDDGDEGGSTDPLDDPTADHTDLTGGTYKVRFRYQRVWADANVLDEETDFITMGSSNVVSGGVGGANVEIGYGYSIAPIAGYDFVGWWALQYRSGKWYYLIDSNNNKIVYPNSGLYFWPAGDYEFESVWKKSGSSTSGEGKVKVRTSTGWKDCTPHVCVKENGVLKWKECKAYVNTDGTYNGWTITKI